MILSVLDLQEVTRNGKPRAAQHSRAPSSPRNPSQDLLAPSQLLGDLLRSFLTLQALV